jgi:hypothetical protein
MRESVESEIGVGRRVFIIGWIVFDEMRYPRAQRVHHVGLQPQSRSPSHLSSKVGTAH